MVMDLPPILCENMCRWLIAKRRPAYLHLDRIGRVLSGGGDLEAYRISPRSAGQSVSEIFDFMEGMLPLDDDACHLECLQPQTDTCIDAHIVPDGPTYWLMLLDMSEEERKIQAMQQKANELALIQDAQAGEMNQVSGLPVSDDVVLTFAPEGERVTSVVLAGGIRMGSDKAAMTAPADILKRLDLFRRRLAGLLQAESGLICARRSDMLIGLFGLRPAKTERGPQALGTAFKIVKDAAQLMQDPKGPADTVYPSVGVATGTVIVGLESSDGLIRMQAVGEPIEAAARLQQQAAAGQVLIDQSTFESAGDMRDRFQPLPEVVGFHRDKIFAWQRT